MCTKWEIGTVRLISQRVRQAAREELAWVRAAPDRAEGMLGETLASFDLLGFITHCALDLLQ